MKKHLTTRQQAKLKREEITKFIKRTAKEVLLNINPHITEDEFWKRFSPRMSLAYQSYYYGDEILIGTTGKRVKGKLILKGQFKFWLRWYKLPRIVISLKVRG
jgi:hypothetical protein